MFQTTNHKSSNLILNGLNMVAVSPLSMFGFQATSHRPCHFVAAGGPEGMPRRDRAVTVSGIAEFCHSFMSCTNMVAAVVTN